MKIYFGAYNRKDSVIPCASTFFFSKKVECLESKSLIYQEFYL